MVSWDCESIVLLANLETDFRGGWRVETVGLGVPRPWPPVRQGLGGGVEARTVEDFFGEALDLAGDTDLVGDTEAGILVGLMWGGFFFVVVGCYWDV